MSDIATNIATTVERMTMASAQSTRSGSFAGVYADNARVLNRLANTNLKFSSSTEAMNQAMFKRASVMERLALANERGNEREAYFMKKQLQSMDEHIKLIKSVNDLEVKREKIIKARQTHEAFAEKQKKAGMKVSAKYVEHYKQTLEELNNINEEYSTQVRVLRKVADGVTDVKKANELVTKEIEDQTTAYETSVKSRRERLDAAMAAGMGDKWDKAKTSIKDRLITFTSLGAAAGLFVSALKDMSKDSDEVVNAMYRMGESMDKTNTGFLNYAFNVAKLNTVQSSLRATAATLNLPVEAVDGMTDAIMHQIRVYDKAGDISMRTVEKIGKTALTYARMTNTDSKEAIELMSTLNNKLGYDTTKQVRAGVTELDDQLQGIQAAVITVNDAMDAAGNGKATIFIEDVAKLMQEAASSTDGFSLSLKSLALNVSKQIGDAKALGATYNEALGQAKTMSEFLTKRNDLVNYKIGNKIIGDVRKNHGDLIANRDVEGLTKALQSEYGMKSANEANAAARNIISGRGPAAVSAGKLIGGTEKGQEMSLGVIADEIRKRMQALPEGQTLSTSDLAAVGGTMGIDVTTESGMGMMNTFIQQAEAAKKKGTLGTNFLAGQKTDEYKKNMEKMQTEAAEKNAPVTPTSLKNTLEAVFKSPLVQMGLGLVAMGTAIAFNATALAGIWANTTIMAKNALMPGAGGGAGIAADILGGDVKGAAGKAGGKALGLLKGGGKWLIGSTKGRVLLAATAAAIGGYELYTHNNKDAKDRDAREKADASAKADEDYAGLQATLTDPDATPQAKADAKKKLAEIDAQRAKDRENFLSGGKPVTPESPNPTNTTQQTMGQTMEQAVPPADDRTLGSVLAGGVASTAVGAAGSAVFNKVTGKAASSGLSHLIGAGGEAGIKSLVAKEGAKVAGKTAAKTGLRAIPFLGSILSGVLTAATTEGSWGRKAAAGLGDAGGSALGSFLGPVGSIAGGYGGEKAGLALYDNLLADKPLAEPVTVPPGSSASPTAPGSAAQANPTGLQGGFNAGNVSLPATMKDTGNFVTLMIPKQQYMGVTQRITNKIAGMETGLSGF